MDNLPIDRFQYVSQYNLAIAYMSFYLLICYELIAEHIVNVILIIHLNGILD